MARLRSAGPFVPFFALLLALASGPAIAQDAPTEAAAPDAPPPIQVISAGNVPERAEATMSALRALIPEPPSQELVDQEAEEIAADKKAEQTRIREVREGLETHPKVAILEALERQLLSLRKPLENRDATLDKQATLVRQSLETVEQEAAIWKATALQASDAGPTARARIQSTRDDITRIQRVLVKRRNTLVALRDELIGPKAELDGLLQRVQTEKQRRLEDVFSSTRSPVWNSEVREALVREWNEGLGDSIQVRAREIRDYARSEQKKLGFELLLFLALTAGLHSLRMRVRRELEHHDDLKEAAQVFELPTSMALLVSLALLPQLHPLAPPLFIRLAGVAAIGPAVLIARRLLPSTMSPLLLGVMVFFLADRVRDLISILPTLERVILQAELVVAVCFLLYLRRPSRLAKISTEMLANPTFRYTGMAIRVGLFVLIAALVIDVIGFGDLADLLGTATLRSGYMGLFVYAIGAVVQSLAAYLLLVRPLRLMRGLQRHRSLVRERISRFVQLAGLGVWIYAVLGLFGIRDTAAEAAAAILDAGVSVGALSISLSDVLVFVLTVWVTFQLARLIHFTLENDVYPRVRLARGVPYAISSLIRYTVIVLGVMAALAATGIELSKLSVVAGGLGVGIGFGLQTVVNNFVSGLILLFERPLQVGDSVQLTDLWGTIERIGIRASVIRTFDGAEVIVPNGLLIADPVTNWTLSDQRRRLDVNIGVEYGTDAQKVIDLLLEVVQNDERILEDPEPAAFFVAFGDSSLDFLLRFWIPQFEGGYMVRSAVAVEIQKALKDAGIGVPFPQRDLHLKTVSSEVRSALPSQTPRSDEG